MCKISSSDNILLIGFMGAGKTTIARALGKAAGFRIIDLDAMIVERRGRAIAEIFSSEGEEAFRDYESEALRSLAPLSHAVVATGGGVIGRQENREFLRSLGAVVYLRASWETLSARLAASDDRPLADPAAGLEKARQLWLRRLPLYEQAEIIIDTDEKSPAEVARAILQAIGVENV
jgi:shikimate kinase